jgi:hypothetical protein
MAQEQDDVQALKERVRELEKKIIEIEMEVELKNNGGYCPPSMMEAKLRLSKVCMQACTTHYVYIV